MRQFGAEFLGTFWLVLGGCGSAVLAAAFPNVGIGLLGVSLAFGLTVLTMAYAIGHISGCHLNPAVSVGLWAGGRFPANKLFPYVVAQVCGAIAAGAVLYIIASGTAGFDVIERLCLERLWCTFTRRLLASCRFCNRNRHDHVFSSGHTWRNRQTGAGWFCSSPHWSGVNAHSSCQHPGDQHLSQSGSKYRGGVVRRRLGNRAALALLAGTHSGRTAGSSGLSLDLQRRKLKTQLFFSEIGLTSAA